MTNRRRKTKKNNSKCWEFKQAQAKIHKLRLHSSRNVQKKESVGATGPGKSGLECSRCRDKVHVSCVGKAYLQYVEGYDDSDDDDFEFLCTRCFRFDDNSSIDTYASESD